MANPNGAAKPNAIDDNESRVDAGELGQVVSLPRSPAAKRAPESQPSARPGLLGMVHRLEARRDQLHAQAREVRSQLDSQLLDSPGDVGDVSVVDANADFSLTMAEQARGELQQIGDALERLHRGTYGLCQSCGNEVSMERLEKLPYARYCIDCQSALEAGRHTRGIRSSTKL